MPEMPNSGLDVVGHGLHEAGDFPQIEEARPLAGAGFQFTRVSGND
jgi:hypothetical protein